MQTNKRRFYEIWGDLEAQNNTLKITLLGLLAAIIVALVLSYLGMSRPPVVIRVTEAGRAEAIKDISTNNAVTDPEIIYFAKLFIEKFTEYNSYTITTDLKEAFALMTPAYQKIAKKEVIDSNLVSQIAQASIYSQVEIREIRIEKQDEHYAILSFLGVRTIRSYKDREFKEESLFKGDAILRKVNRNLTNPHGLLLEEYREVLVKELNQ